MGCEILQVLKIAYKTLLIMNEECFFLPKI